MAQADYKIDNAPGINVRAELNDTFAAIVTNNSGTAAPDTKYPGMFWLDLSITSKPNGVWRYRDQTNNSWLELFPAPDGVIVPNLNADMLDGYHASAFALKSEMTSLVGSMQWFAASAAPANYLKVNGAMLLRTAYPELWTFAQQSGLLAANQAQRDANWCLWGPGDGTSSFQLPDLRGVFLRVADEGRGVDSGRGNGTTQGQAFQSHNHTGATDTQGWHGHGGSTGGVGDHQHVVPWGEANQNDAPWGTYENGHYGSSNSDWDNQWRMSSWTGGHAHGLSIDGSGNHTHNVTVYAAGGAETRPINGAYPLFIRYK